MNIPQVYIPNIMQMTSWPSDLVQNYWTHAIAVTIGALIIIGLRILRNRERRWGDTILTVTNIDEETGTVYLTMETEK